MSRFSMPASYRQSVRWEIFGVYNTVKVNCVLSKRIMFNHLLLQKMRKLRCKENTKRESKWAKYVKTRKHEHLESGNIQIPLKNFM